MLFSENLGFCCVGILNHTGYCLGPGCCATLSKCQLLPNLCPLSHQGCRSRIADFLQKQTFQVGYLGRDYLDVKFK